FAADSHGDRSDTSMMLRRPCCVSSRTALERENVAMPAELAPAAMTNQGGQA
ncbi:MAG: hypothetical protein ACJAQ9_002289, partial [Ilumatobacter sp.]